MDDWRYWVAGLIFGLIAAMFIAWYMVERATAKRSNRVEEDARHKRLEDARQMLALTCRECGNPALPIATTSNRYRCDHCNREFAAAQHGLDERSFW